MMTAFITTPTSLNCTFCIVILARLDSHTQHNGTPNNIPHAIIIANLDPSNHTPWPVNRVCRIKTFDIMCLKLQINSVPPLSAHHTTSPHAIQTA